MKESISEDEFSYLRQIIKLINDTSVIKAHYQAHLAAKYSLKPEDSIQEDGSIARGLAS
jgi:hypothetical protein